MTGRAPGISAAAMWLTALLPLVPLAASAAPITGVWTYAFAEYGDIKYPEGFGHYDFANPNAPKGGTLRLSNPDRRTSFDKYNPYTLPTNSPSGVQYYMFEPLADASPDEPATMYGLLASQMLIAPDYSAISFRINPLAHFNNGDPVTVQDVQYSFQMATGEFTEPTYALYFQGVKDMVVLDAHTVRFDLKTPSRDQIFLLGTKLVVFSRKWGQGPDGKPKPFNQIVHDIPIATGPYLIAKGTGQMLDLVRDPHYWAQNLGVRKGFYNFDHLIYHYYADEAVRFEGFKAGDFDLKEEYSAKRFVRLYTGPKFRDGRIIKREFPSAMGFLYEGFLFNTRRSQLSDPRVREALNYAFDWRWSLNQHFGIGKRFDGLFKNSIYDVAGTLPSAGELALLEPYRKQLPAEVFGMPKSNPLTDTAAELRENLITARAMLAASGWTIHPDGLLRNAQGEAFQIEVLEDNLEFEPFILRWGVGLKKLGITLRTRLVDFAVYQKRLDAFDFDCTLIKFDDFKLPSPSTLKDFFSTTAAHTQGSDNLSGIDVPAIDHIIDQMSSAKTRDDIINGARAIDRIFMAGHYAIPYRYLTNKLVAYWDRFGMPTTLPAYYSIDDNLAAMAWPIATWWAKDAH